MNAVKKIIENSTNPLIIELPKEYEHKKLEVTVTELPDEKDLSGKKKYNFSDLSGKLNWADDPVEYQKKLRNEWE